MAGDPARSVQRQVSSLLNGMNGARIDQIRARVLTSDLHGGCGPKLTSGF